MKKPANPQRYAKVPMEVITDTKVSLKSRVIYSFLAGCAFDGPRVRVGQRYIAEAIGVSLGAVNSSIKELAAAGHLETIPGASGKRNAYDLKSPVFSYSRARRYAGGLTSTVRAARMWAERPGDGVQ